MCSRKEKKKRMEIKKNRRWSLMLIIQARGKHEGYWEHKANLGLERDFQGSLSYRARLCLTKPKVEGQRGNHS